MHKGYIINATNKYSFISAFTNDNAHLSDTHFKTVKVYVNIQSNLKYNSRPYAFKTEFIIDSCMLFPRCHNKQVLLSMFYEFRGFKRTGFILMAYHLYNNMYY